MTCKSVHQTYRTVLDIFSTLRYNLEVYQVKTLNVLFFFFTFRSLEHLITMWFKSETLIHPRSLNTKYIKCPLNFYRMQFWSEKTHLNKKKWFNKTAEIASN